MPDNGSLKAVSGPQVDDRRRRTEELGNRRRRKELIGISLIHDLSGLAINDQYAPVPLPIARGSQNSVDPPSKRTATRSPVWFLPGCCHVEQAAPGDQENEAEAPPPASRPFRSRTTRTVFHLAPPPSPSVRHAESRQASASPLCPHDTLTLFRGKRRSNQGGPSRPTRHGPRISGQVAVASPRKSR